MKITRAAKQAEHEVLPASWVAGRGGAPGAAFACHGWVRPPARPPPLAVWAWSAKRCDCPSRPPASRARNKHKQRNPGLNEFLASGHRAWQARRGHGKQDG